jgi:hypothetical protein
MVGTDKVSGGVAIFEIVKGATDFIIAITLWQIVNCLDLKYFTSVLIMASAILTGFGMSLFYTVLFLLMLNKHVQ